MKYREFGRLGWRVSEVGLGCWQIGWCWGDIEEKDARKIIHTALDKGVNFFDTSDTYGDGRSERFLSEIKNLHRTGEIYITTKLGRRIRGTNYVKGYKHEPMEEYVDRSLSNLGVEVIDLVQMHCPPLEVCQKAETYELMDRLVESGKIRHYGISVYSMSEALAAIENPNIASIQFVFNIFRQRPRDVIFQKAKEKKVALIVRGPLASGLLSGEIDESTKFPDNDHRNYNRDGSAFDIGDTFSGVPLEEGVRAVKELIKLLPAGMNMSQFAISWILSHPEITTVIPGAVKSKQVSENVASKVLDNFDKINNDVSSIYNGIIKRHVVGRW